jgi:recombinational DNA repair protein (RecF pathway)
MALDAFAESHNIEACLYWFELKLMAAMGISPQLNKCLKCKRSLDMSADPVKPGSHSGVSAPSHPVSMFSFRRGGVLCGACAGSLENDMERMAPDVLGILRFWQQSRDWNSARTSRCTSRQLRDVERLLGRFLQYHLEVGGFSRELALEVMRHRFHRVESSP